MPQPASTQLGLTGGSIYTPLTPYMYSEWASSGSAPRISVDSDVRMANGLEGAGAVRIAELDGPVQTTLDFVNERRAVGGEAPVSLSGDPLMAELRAQRARDFYLTGQRLGDLRRYAKAGIDLFPKGNIRCSRTRMAPRSVSSFRSARRLGIRVPDRRLRLVRLVKSTTGPCSKCYCLR